jgi:hypothetical protein
MKLAANHKCGVLKGAASMYALGSPSNIGLRQKQGILTEGEMLSTVDPLIKVACFVKKVNNIFNIKRS